VRLQQSQGSPSVPLDRKVREEKAYIKDAETHSINYRNESKSASYTHVKL
jgi:hypothetical protein